MEVELAASELIFTLESLIEELRTIENGKNYPPDIAKEKLVGIRMVLEGEGPQG